MTHDNPPETGTPTAAPPADSSDRMASPGPSLAWVVHRIASEIASGRIPPGDVAALRRIEVDDPSTAAFWKALANYVEPADRLPPYGPKRDEAERRWAVILNALAQLSGLDAPGVALGQALAHAGLSEMRLTRLLRARDDALASAVRTTARFLAAKAAPADQAELADLVLSDGVDDYGERVRRRIARAYYHHIA